MTSRPGTAPPSIEPREPTTRKTDRFPDALLGLLEVGHRISVEEFHRMIDRGVFGNEPRVELIEGVIVEKMGKNPPHVLATDLIQYLLIQHLPQRYCFSMANPVTIEGRQSEPEPDAMVLRGNPRDYVGKDRTPGDAALVVEVADSSYSYDRRTKWAVYAGAGVPVYWLLDLNRRGLEVHSEPIGEGLDATYRSSRIYLENEEAPLVLDGREVARFAVSEILP